MTLCRVTGTVTAPRKSEPLRRASLLLVEPVAADGALAGKRELVALDPGHGAGVGDIVLVAKEGAVVAGIFGRKDVPANAVIVAVVEAWDRP